MLWPWNCCGFFKKATFLHTKSSQNGTASVTLHTKRETPVIQHTATYGKGKAVFIESSANRNDDIQWSSLPRRSDRTTQREVYRLQRLCSAMSGHTKSSDMDHTVLPANYTMPTFCFASVHQMAPPLTEVEGIWLELTTHSSTPKGWQADIRLTI